MPQPILPITIHPENYNPDSTVTRNVSSIHQGTKQYVTFLQDDNDDPVWMKCKSLVFNGAGRVQSKLGTVTGVDTFRHRGQAWVSWAAHTSEHADFLTEHGATSRLHGEYNRWTGYFGKMLNHLTTANLETSSFQHTDYKNGEIDYSGCRSSSA